MTLAVAVAVAVAAAAELRRRHRDQQFSPLRSAEPGPVIQAQRDELSQTAGEQVREMGQWIKDLTDDVPPAADMSVIAPSPPAPGQRDPP